MNPKEPEGVYDDVVTSVLSPLSRSRQAEAERSRRQHFIRGPIPMPWLERAARLPGKTLAVGLLIWFLWGMSRGAPVRLNPAVFRRFKIGRQAGYHALDALVAAGLILADRARGRSPTVTIVSTTVQPDRN